MVSCLFCRAIAGQAHALFCIMRPTVPLMTSTTKTLFSPTELDRLLAALPPPADTPAGKKVVIGADGDQSGQTVYAGFKLTPHGDGLAWELKASARHDRRGDWTYGTDLILDWP